MVVYLCYRLFLYIFTTDFSWVRLPMRCVSVMIVCFSYGLQLWILNTRYEICILFCI